MPDTMRIRSTLPVSIVISEPHPDPERPGNSPALKSAVIKPGLNEGVDAELYRAWAGVGGKDFVASDDDVKAGKTDAKVFEMAEDEPEIEYGFEVALKRALDAGGDEAAKGSAHTAPAAAIDMSVGSHDPIASPAALTSEQPLKLPGTDDGMAQGKPAPKPMTEAEMEHATRPEPAKV